MSKKVNWPDKHGQMKEIHGHAYYLGHSCDLINGKGWFCQVYRRDPPFKASFGFHKTNKFAAVRSAQQQLGIR